MDSGSSQARASGWRRAAQEPPLADVFGSIAMPHGGGRLRRLLSFIGPGYLVAVGYMDPGNWATSIAGGAQFGYALLFIVLLSNIMAIVLQSLATRLAIGSGRDLAQACRDAWPKPVSRFLWLGAEIAIVATDIAEVVGTAIGLNLLFDIPLELGVILTAADVMLVLLLQRLGFRWIEAFVISLLAIIFVCFGVQLALVRPDWWGVLGGFAPHAEILHNPAMLYLALGIIGATVMPHNLYLHSGIVLTRAIGDSPAEKREVLRYANWDSGAALTFALTINAAILILAAATFYASGNRAVAEIGEAHRMLAPLVGSLLAPKLFAIALLACGLNSTLTATMAGQIVMEGFLDIRLAAWARRLLTRLVAIVPAVTVTLLYGARGTGFLLIFSQVVLAFQLPFAIIPLILFTRDRAKMRGLAAPTWLTLLASLIAAVIIILNAKLVWDVLTG